MPNFHRISEAPWVHSFGTDWETQFTLHHHCDNKKECWNIQNGYKKTMKRVNLKTHCSLGSAFRCSWTQVREKEAKTILQFLYEAAVLNSTPFSFSYLTISEKMEKLCFSSTTYWVAIGESDFFFLSLLASPYNQAKWNLHLAMIAMTCHISPPLCQGCQMCKSSKSLSASLLLLNIDRFPVLSANLHLQSLIFLDAGDKIWLGGLWMSCEMKLTLIENNKFLVLWVLVWNCDWRIARLLHSQRSRPD